MKIHNPGFVDYLKTTARLDNLTTISQHDARINHLLRSYGVVELKNCDIDALVMDYCRKTVERTAAQPLRSSDTVCKSYRSSLRLFINYLNAGGVA